MKIGSHVGMSGKEMMLGSVKEALSYGANTFMLYTGAPQNTRRKDVSELRVEEAWELMRANDITEFVVHAPYIINLANTVKPEIYQLAVDFLKTEIERTAAMGSKTLVLHPGSHVNAGADAGIDSIIKGLNEVLTQDTPVHIALETMAGKGSEIGRSFEELARIYDGVTYNDKLRVCFDTCHTNDAGYDVANDFDSVIEEFDKIIGKEIVLEDYSLRALTDGEDAQSEAIVKIRVDGSNEVVTGRGVSVDVIEASIKAYINGINKYFND